MEELGDDAGLESVFFQGDRGVEDANDRVADVFVHIASVFHENIGHAAEIFIHEAYELLRGEDFREGGESLNIGKESRDLGIDASECRFFAALDHFIHEIWREVGAEHAFDASFLLAEAREIEQGTGKRASQSRTYGCHEWDNDVVMRKNPIGTKDVGNHHDRSCDFGSYRILGWKKAEGGGKQAEGKNNRDIQPDRRTMDRSSREDGFEQVAVKGDSGHWP